MANPSVGYQRYSFARQWRLTLKELREILRDRRTVVTLVLMPILVYPLLSLGMQRMLLTGSGPQQGEPAIVLVQAAEAEPLRRFLERGIYELRANGEFDVERHLTFAAADVSNGPDDIRQAVRTGRVDVGLVGMQRQANRWELTLYYRREPISLAALERLERILYAAQWSVVRRRLAEANVRLALPTVGIRQEQVEPEAGPSPLATLMPLVLILMTITGAVYPAIDLTAGERERGTLETLVAAPVARWRLLVAKYIAVLVVALLTASVNLCAMTITLHVSGLTSLVFGPLGFSWHMVSLVFVLLFIFASFFSALLLAITSVARSFKEAQAYLIPLMLVALAPGLLSMVPGIELNALLATLPLVNIVLVARDLFLGTAHVGWIAVALVTTLFYAAAALSLASYVFGSDAILYGSPLSWHSWGRRPHKPMAVASPSIAWSCVALAFPLQFMVGGLVIQAQVALAFRLAAAAAITAVVYGVLPFVVGWWYRVQTRTGLGLAAPSIPSLVAAVVLGLSLWPMAHGAFWLALRAGLVSIDPARLEGIDELLAQWRQVPAWYRIIALGVVPGLCEELFFRGWVFGAAERKLGALRAIVLSALLFAAFHVVNPQWLSIERFAPSFALGLVLGSLRWYARSVLPAMVTHAVHNSLLLSLTPQAVTLEYLARDELVQRTLPWYWYAASLTVVALWLAVLWQARRKDQLACHGSKGIAVLYDGTERMDTGGTSEVL